MFTVRADPVVPDCSGVSQVAHHQREDEGGEGDHKSSWEGEQETSSSSSVQQQQHGPGRGECSREGGDPERAEYFQIPRAGTENPQHVLPVVQRHNVLLRSLLRIHLPLSRSLHDIRPEVKPE